MRVTAQFQVVLAGGALQVFVEQPFELAHGHLVEAGQLFEGQWFLEVGLHDRHHLAEFGLGTAEQGAQRHPLAVALATHAITQQQFGGLGGDSLATGLAGYQLQHHVHRRHPARAGITVAVQLEQLAGDDNAGKMRLQGWQVFPVDGTAVAGEQLGLGQQVTAGADTAQGQVLPCQVAQPFDQRAVAAASVDRVGAYHQQRVQGRGVGDAVVGQYAHAVAGHHRCLIRRNQHTAKQGLMCGQVGHAQGFDGRCQADRGEIGQNQKAEGLDRTTLYT